MTRAANERAIDGFERFVTSRLRGAVAVAFVSGAAGNPCRGFMRQRLISMRLPSDRVLGAMLAHPRSIEAVDRREDSWWLREIGEAQDRLGRLEHPYYRFADTAELMGRLVFFVLAASCIAAFVLGATIEGELASGLAMIGSALALIALLTSGLASHRMTDSWSRRAGRVLEAAAMRLPQDMWDERDGMTGD